MLHLALLALAQAPTPLGSSPAEVQPLEDSTPEVRSAGAPITVPMQPCELLRPVDRFYMKTSKRLVLEGTVTVGEERFSIYLPKDRQGYSTAPRPERAGILTAFTSTCLAVDQDHDGVIAPWESTYAENPLRVGDAMFEVLEIANDGTLTLQPSDAPLSGPVIGRKAPDFAWTTPDGKVLRNDDFAGRALVIDVWAPS